MNVESANYLLQHLIRMAPGRTVAVPVLSNPVTLSHQNSQVLPGKQYTGCIFLLNAQALNTLSHCACNMCTRAVCSNKRSVMAVLLNLTNTSRHQRMAATLMMYKT